MASGWSRPGGTTTDGATDGPAGAAAAAGAGAAGAHVPASCRVCPLCQLIARVQDVHPEVVGHLADATSSLAAALSELAASREHEAQRPAREETQHIDIGD
jgi:hypothetical protein